MVHVRPPAPPAAPASFARRHRFPLPYTPFSGRIYAQNSYDFATAATYNILFFREALPHVSSTSSLDRTAIEQWARTSTTADAASLRIGMYFPFEGEQLYETLLQLGWGSVGLRSGLLVYLQTTQLTSIVSDIALPTYMFSILDGGDLQAKGIAVDTRVPYAQISTKDTPYPALRTEIPRPTVADMFGLEGKLSYNSRNEGGKFNRVSTTRNSSPDTEGQTLSDFLQQINAIGLRVWPLVPLDLLSNNSNNKDWVEWRDMNIMLARKVAEVQSTAVLAVGASYLETAQIPPDFLVVANVDNSPWRFF